MKIIAKPPNLASHLTKDAPDFPKEIEFVATAGVVVDGINDVGSVRPGVVVAAPVFDNALTVVFGMSGEDGVDEKVGIAIVRLTFSPGNVSSGRAAPSSVQMICKSVQEVFGIVIRRGVNVTNHQASFVHWCN